MDQSDQFKDYLQRVYKKIKTVIERGEKIIEQIPNLVKKSMLDKIDIDCLQAALVSNRALKRRYGTTQAGEMANVSHSLIYNAEKDGRLPHPVMRKDTKKATRAGYTINDINHIREVFGTAPRKPPKSRAAIIGMLNLKGGSQKTTHCQLFAQYLALKGYRVLCLDTDPQGSLSLYFGKRPDVDVDYEHTMAPYLLEDEDTLIECGFPKGSSENLRYAVQKTYWNNIDIIPSCLQNLNIDLLMPKIMDYAGAAPIDKVSRLGAGLRDLGADAYDFIILDGTPSLNLSTLNVVSACDIVFVPTPAMFADYASTLKFTSLISELIETYDEQGVYPNIPDIRYFITKFSSNSASKFWSQIIRRVFTVEPGDVLTNESYHSDEIGKSTTNIASVYEVVPTEADNRQRLKKTIEMFDKLFKEMHDEVWASHFGVSPRSPITSKSNQIKYEAELVEKELGELIGEGE